MQDRLFFPRAYAFQLLLAAFNALFFAAACLVYDPWGIQATYQGVGGMGAGFHLMMLTSILFVAQALCRFLPWALRKRGTPALLPYLFYCVGETVVAAAFMALYAALFFKSPYFPHLATALKQASLLLIYPYGFSVFYLLLAQARQELATAQEGPTKLTKFYDQNNKLKLSIDSEALLFIEADANYVRIHYLDNGNPKVYPLRTPMKRVCETVEKVGLVRCHRSFLVNPRHIRALSRNKLGVITAELKVPDTPALPVSKPFYEALTRLI